MSHQLVMVIDFGGQYNHLIARRVRDCKVYCEVFPYTVSMETIKEKNPIGIIFTGGPNSVFQDKAPLVNPEIYTLGIPVLGICYGMQMISQQLGGHVTTPKDREYGKVTTHITSDSPIFEGLNRDFTAWMSHTDYVDKVPGGFKVMACTDTCPTAAIENSEKKIFGFQFHPEVTHCQQGLNMLKNFLFNVCKADGDWSMSDYAKTAINDIKTKVGNGKVLLALSGGVDSSVCAALLEKAVGDQLTCIFVDHGLMRKNEGDEIEKAFANSNLKLVRINAEERFLSRLKGITDPETKRKIIGEEFIRVFEEEGKKIGSVDFLAQGTIYPDVVESGLGESRVIKSHHNVGGLPEYVDFKALVEPLRMLFKDEVRALGEELGLPSYLVWRQPFPGPGLGIRVIGELTKEKLDNLRDADAIFREEIAAAGLDKSVNQYFAVLTNMRSVGVMGDERTYDYTLALRAVSTTDFMSADWAKIPYDVLDKASSRIVNEVRGINRIVYDITSKPPATIEWE